MNCFLSLLCYFVMCYFMGIVIFSTDFHLFVECVGVFCIAVMFYVPLLLYSHCGLNPSGLCMLFFHPCPIVSWHCRDTKSLPTDFHWSMDSGHTTHYVMLVWWGMFVCRHCGLFVCLRYYYTRWWWKIQ